MPSDAVKFTLRTEPELLKKIFVLLLNIMPVLPIVNWKFDEKTHCRF